MSKNQSIPSIDINSFLNGTDEERDKIGRLVDEICSQVGFLKIKNHCIEEKIINDMWSVSEEFFSNTENEKNKAKPIDNSSPRGYFPMQSETLTKSRGIETPPDLKEAFSIGPLNSPATKNKNNDFFYGENIWPSSPSSFKKVWIDYYQAMQQLSLEIMSLFAVSLNLEKDYFDRYYTHHISALRALNYPPTKTKQLPNQQRAGAHTDYGSLTILLPDPNVGGLEVKYADGTWVPIQSEKNTFIINIGDMMARLTNDRWVSTLHRVTSCNEEALSPKRRQSIAYFQNPNFDAEISCLPTCLDKNNQSKYQDIEAGLYLMDRFKATIN